MRCCCTGSEQAVHSVPVPLRRSPATREKVKVWSRRVTALAQWGMPLATLALVPKSPACVAAYVLLFTGIGLSLAAASAVLWVLVMFSFLAVWSIVIRTARSSLRLKRVCDRKRVIQWAQPQSTFFIRVLVSP